jgi:hypothetical protein
MSEELLQDQIFTAGVEAGYKMGLDAAIDEVRKIHTHNERSGAPRSVVMYSMDILEVIEALKEKNPSEEGS